MGRTADSQDASRPRPRLDPLRARTPTIEAEPDLSLAAWRDAEQLFRAVREAVVPVDQPLVLISQVQRSGGTLLNTLLDGHPQLHVHPYELHIGHPTKYEWPVLGLDAEPDEWLLALEERFVRRLFAHGYSKGSSDPSTLPFTLVPSFLDRLFRVLCAEQPPRSAREVIGRYLTAFFNAWIGCQGLRETPKAWVAAFGPQLAWGESRSRFFADFPDGRVIAAHRDPRAWYASASRSDRYGSFDAALELWRRGAGELSAAKRERPDQVFVLTYEGLVSEPERVMRALAAWLGIDWTPLLVRPTFNREPTTPNSSHGPLGPGIQTESLDRWRDVLAAETAAEIEARVGELDRAVRAIADSG